MFGPEVSSYPVNPLADEEDVSGCLCLGLRTEWAVGSLQVMLCVHIDAFTQLNVSFMHVYVFLFSTVRVSAHPSQVLHQV